MTSQQTKNLDGYAAEHALRSLRLAEGDRQAAVDHLVLMVAGDPVLQQAVAQVGITRLVSEALPGWRKQQRLAALEADVGAA
ncbi:MAG: hypothetical protein ACFCUQ_09395 [Kiloniellales bacterium]